MILCCECGVSILPNPGNMCSTCLRKNVDITEGIQKQGLLQYCRNCERYLQPPAEWKPADRGSRELLAICLKKLKGLKEVELVDAVFIWTEPHSKRIKLEITVHGEISTATIQQKVFIVEFTVQNQMCTDCHRIEAKDFWNCLVQLRQHSENKKTYFFLEQLILKNKAHANTLGIKPNHGGLDFYFANQNHARKLLEFLQAVMPVRVHMSKRLISHDVQNNYFYNRYTYSVEIVPLSKDSAVCLSKRWRQICGNISPICLVHKVTGGIHLIDPLTAQISELTGQSYFRAPFASIFNPKQLIEYIVMDIEIIDTKNTKHYPGKGQVSLKHILSDIWVIRASELGTNDNQIHTRSHLGHLLNVGDSVMCYNLSEANVNDIEYEKLSNDELPDVILVRKCYPQRQKRNWKLKYLTEDQADERNKHDFDEFLDDLDDDPDCRKQIHTYDEESHISSEMDLNSSNELVECFEDLQLDSTENSTSYDIPIS